MGNTAPRKWQVKLRKSSHWWNLDMKRCFHFKTLLLRKKSFYPPLRKTNKVCCICVCAISVISRHLSKLNDAPHPLRAPQVRYCQYITPHDTYLICAQLDMSKVGACVDLSTGNVSQHSQADPLLFLTSSATFTCQGLLPYRGPKICRESHVSQDSRVITRDSQYFFFFREGLWGTTKIFLWPCVNRD